MKFLAFFMALLLFPSIALAVDVTVELAFSPGPNTPIDSTYLPYVCPGVCDETGEWLPEKDKSGTRVVIPGGATCQPEEGQVVCRASYDAWWPYNEVWSFYLTAVHADNGLESLPSEVITKSHLPPTTTTTTTTTSTVPPEPPAPPQFLDIKIRLK